MSFLHNLFSKLADAAKPATDDAKAELLKHTSFLSVRTLFVVAFVGYLLWLNHLLLTPENLVIAGKLIALLIVCNSITKLGFAIINGWIITTQTKIFNKDDRLDENELSALRDSTKSTNSTDDSKTP